MAVNILTVHYNTPELTEALVRSVNKHTPDSIIYIFDNSDSRPFTAHFPNVRYIDNTKGQIVDFEKFLEKWPTRLDSAGVINKWGSVKHCYSVEVCMKIIGSPFVLLDSDVLVKRDLSELCDESCIYVGKPYIRNKGGVVWRMRLLPMVCFINTSMCKRYGIHYFDDYRINGLCNFDKFADSELWDTGASFWADSVHYNHRDIPTIKDYVVHFAAGSWNRPSKKNKVSHSEWLIQHKELWQ